MSSSFGAACPARKVVGRPKEQRWGGNRQLGEVEGEAVLCLGKSKAWGWEGPNSERLGLGWVLG